MLQEAYLMNVEGGASNSPADLGNTGWAPPSWAEAPAYAVVVDLLVTLAAVTLPWSMTATAVLMVCWSIAVIPTIDWDELIRSLTLPACALPLALFALADVGVLWSEGPWEAELQAINPVSKLLLLPLLLYHFRRSERAVWVFVGFLVSSMALMMLSWIALADPSLMPAGLRIDREFGQRQQFTLCALALAAAALAVYERGQIRMAIGLAGSSLVFFAHDLVADPARTTCVATTILLLVLLIRHFSRRIAVVLLASAAVTGGVAWAATPLLSGPIVEIVVHRHMSALNGGGPVDRQADWRRSIASIAEAPLFGHGTGAIRPLSAIDAPGPREMRGTARDPQNQSLSVVLQWGLAGLILLYAMWISHIRLVRGGDWIAWVGLVIVVQTVVGSLLSANLFDLNEGWIYVIGVGVAGGVALGRGSAADPLESLRSGLGRMTVGSHDGEATAA
ncbi:O-antigen ligase family protein [Bradyrhizobium ontarionense]|uniref:O-antigen ligase family protein n=1 Tax=Bradyrhizobium ontarionense TaxID=2898149 RepID=A0ABY3R3C7_9BRAD|nr:O-antigen ligase family protein [Bradyrhizobium sp. A19]UFZ01559.1 O-antigen ligase family protein [Bradyrhizobium sp. A19]